MAMQPAVCLPTVPGDAGPLSYAYMCAACNEGFNTAEDFRMHSKSDRHVYNTKRKLSSLKPISQEAWDRKLREARAAAGNQNKGTAHLKAGKEKKPKESSESVSQSEGTEADTPTSAMAIEEGPPSPRRSLFDRKHFETLEECLRYMEKKYSFFVPDVDYCADVAGLLLYLRSKMEEPPYLCICCNRPFKDLSSVRKHMLDKCHTHLASEAFTRRGNTDQDGTEIMQAELAPFYNFQSSVREVMERMTVQQRAAALLRYFDEDGDGLLNQEELGALWEAAEDGQELSSAMYEGACAKAKADPEEGLDARALHALYASGLADIDVHFAMLQERLSKAMPKQKQGMTPLVEENQLAPVEEDEAQEAADEDDDDEGSDGDESDFEVVECEDEDEFDEVMRVLGLEPVDITDTGDLRLPNGAVASHRAVSHIFRQRGQRMEAEQIAAYKHGRRAIGDRKDQLMIANGANGGLQLTHRQANKEGRKVLAMLRQQTTMEVRVAMKQNLLQTNRVMKCRSVRGDASGAGGGGR